jgi:hypothetical protein
MAAMRRAVAILLGFAFFGFGCSTQEQLGSVGDRCDYDEQCQTTLVCRCVTYTQPDPEGNVNVVDHGFCEAKSFNNDKCPNDAGDATPVDAGGETTSDIGAGTISDAGGEGG